MKRFLSRWIRAWADEVEQPSVAKRGYMDGYWDGFADGWRDREDMES